MRSPTNNPIVADKFMKINRVARSFIFPFLFFFFVKIIQKTIFRITLVFEIWQTADLVYDDNNWKI